MREWAKLKNDHVCRRIVSGISSNIVRERLLRSEIELSFQKAIDMCRIAELSKQQMKLFGGETDQASVSQVTQQSTSQPKQTQEEHDERLIKLLQRARDCNLKLNPDKSRIRKTEVLYIGHVLTGNRVKPDASKLEAITKMPAPEDKHGVQRLLGMVNYVAKFAPNVSEKTAPLLELLKKDVAWHWTERHE